jgi:hypothetical protein
VKRFAFNRWRSVHIRIVVCLSTRRHLGVVNISCTRHWNDEPIGTLPVKRMFLFVPSSEYGKPMSAAVYWSAYTTPGYSGRPGRRGKNAYGIRENLKVWQLSNHFFDISSAFTHNFSETFIRCRAGLCPAFPGHRCLLSPPGLAQAPCYAAGRADLRGAICPCSATISHSLQVARAVARTPEAFPSGEDRS